MIRLIIAVIVIAIILRLMIGGNFSDYLALMDKK